MAKQTNNQSNNYLNYIERHGEREENGKEETGRNYQTVDICPSFSADSVFAAHLLHLNDHTNGTSWAGSEPKNQRKKSRRSRQTTRQKLLALCDLNNDFAAAAFTGSFNNDDHQSNRSRVNRQMFQF